MILLGDVNEVKDEYLMDIAKHIEKISFRYGCSIKDAIMECECEKLSGDHEFAMRVIFRYKTGDRENIAKLLPYMKK